jgi:hypothetical protein
LLLALAVSTGVVATSLCAAPAGARTPSLKKAIWGPATRDGKSQFPIYHDLGVGIYQYALPWPQVASKQPANPADPKDPAYNWPAELDFVLSEARRYRIKVLIEVTGAPRWANGNRGSYYAPLKPSDYATFVRAAATRYPQVRYWMVWGEPSKQFNFIPPTGDGPTYAHDTPRWYAQILDTAYAALKRANKRNVVIGGNTWSAGDVRPAAFIRGMRLPDGRPPRLDMYGHNPFSGRRPDLRDKPVGDVLDFNDLDTLGRLIDRNLGRTPDRKKIPIFISEFTFPTDHPNKEFNFWVTRATQAAWLRRALVIARRSKRIFSLGWHALYDDPPRRGHDEVNRGLIDLAGNKKPAYKVFRSG